jgi:DNA polymerase III epsilon subunit-like protein
MAEVEKIFFLFDLETNGLPYLSSMDYKFINNWPNTVQISWGLYNEKGMNIKFHNYILKPTNFTIDRDSTKIHGISNSIAKKRGIKFSEIFDDLQNDLQQCDFIVAHNLNFDRNTLLSEFTRCNRNDLVHLFESKRHICTMKESTMFCHIGSPTSGYKWPKLSELYEKLFNRKIRNAHDAEYDVKNLSKCFFELIKRNILRF